MKLAIKNSGYTTIIILIIISISSIVLYSFATLVANQYALSQRQTATEQALQIAESGINYYRWHLAHSPSDFTNGTGGAGPYIVDYNDPQGGKIGQYSLTITPPTSGSTVVTIKSTGSTTQYPNITRTITVQYGKPSMAQYAFLHNSSIWLGSGLEIFGPVHSNGGIRNDAVNHATVTSSLDTYTCGSETGCSPSQTKHGVWGAGGDITLWHYPQTPVDFGSVSVDFATMKTAAQTTGLYLAPSTAWGYHLVFSNSGTFTVYKVTNATNRKGYDNSTCNNLYQGISTQTSIGTYNQSQKSIIFAEDTLWVDGVITNSIEIVGAKFPLATNNIDIWVNNNLTYSTMNNTIHAGVIAQNNIIFARDINTDFIIHAALLAQNGKIFRHNYDVGSCSPSGNAVRNSLSIYGAIISAQKSYWNWGSPPASGFSTRNISYDASMLYSPPPYFPSTGEYAFISWTE